MKKYIAAYFAIAFVMVVVDFIWLGVIAQPLYKAGIGHLMAEQPNLVFAALFYSVYVLGIILFAIKPHAASNGVKNSMLTAAMFGFFVYASYDLTNLALLKDWPLSLALIDMAWGVFISGLSGLAGKFAFNQFK